ncbi:hypothetical protein QUW13_08210 [Enterococcus hirae]|jgi:hypothetical protein|nr:hypothetical protein [Enterococcaceae bacterium]MCI1919208.1 hypothetical protein [Enterococcaceae bacterium]MDM8213859.1 hypothetical protein [Enterococcus hirae]
MANITQEEAIKLAEELVAYTELVGDKNPQIRATAAKVLDYIKATEAVK